MEKIYNAIMSFTGWMWTMPLLVLLIGGGLVITVACDFVQIKHFGFMLRKCIGGAKKGNTEEGKISGWSAMIATLANTIGTGNIVGVGSAIAIGGPGAVFWMWIIGFVAMALKYAEALLGVATRFKDENGNWKGGANIYLSQLWKPLGIIWGLCCVFTMPIACGVHTGAIVDSAKTFQIPGIVATVVFTVIVIFVILGGMGALVKVTDKLVPTMAVVYVLSGLLVIGLNIQNLVPALVSIFTNAFTGTAATGGFAGAALSVAIKNGCARGVYSNDGGNGSASILHAQADIDEPVEQGMYGIFEVFACTMVICTFTALVVLCTGAWTSGDPGSVLAINAFGTIGPVGHFIAAISLMLFAASSALSMATSSGILARDMFGKIMQYIIQVLVVVGCFVGGTVGVDVALPWVDVSNMFLILCNVGGTMFLVGKLRTLTLDYFKSGKDKLI
ncbi:MAG: sodium:alanine symporter family protein [Lawsonibacter sp.]|nr:sodium:alanine symporter family protein [Lawsonibacter sp.]